MLQKKENKKNKNIKPVPTAGYRIVTERADTGLPEGYLLPM
ncbi:hypothetical protein [Rahnella perminowiae]|nr:hypothetical protein [Rahnella perminowiae]